MRAVLIGAGAYASVHAEAVERVEGLDLRAVVDADPARAERMAAGLGIVAFDDIDAACDAIELDLAVVVVPTVAHVDVAVRALRRGLHVLLEKPLARTVTECAELQAEAAHGSLVVDVVSQRRFQASNERVRQALDEGLLGTIGTVHMDTSVWREPSYFTDAPWRGRAAEGGGNLLNHGWHALDLLMWFGGAIDCAQGFRRTSRVPGADVEESLAAALRFESGCLGVLEASLVARGGGRMQLTITGDRGTAWVDDSSARIARLDDGGELVEETWVSASADDALVAQYGALLEAIREGRPLRVGLSEALRTLHAAELILGTAVEHAGSVTIRGA